MLKRTLAGLLWFFSGWMLGGVVTLAGGMPGWWAPVLGAVVAGLLMLDPMRLFWITRPKPVAQALGRSSVLFQGGHAPH